MDVLNQIPAYRSPWGYPGVWALRKHWSLHFVPNKELATICDIGTKYKSSKVISDLKWHCWACWCPYNIFSYVQIGKMRFSLFSSRLNNIFFLYKNDRLHFSFELPSILIRELGTFLLLNLPIPVKTWRLLSSCQYRIGICSCPGHMGGSFSLLQSQILFSFALQWAN